MDGCLVENAEKKGGSGSEVVHDTEIQSYIQVTKEER